MTTESHSIEHYHAKEGWLFFSSIALFLSPFIKLGKPITVTIREFLELPVEISDSIPAIAFFYLSTVALAFYVFVEWHRLEKAERKRIKGWTFFFFEGFALFMLFWRYAALTENFPYGQVSPLWFVPFSVLGYLIGRTVSMSRFAFSLRRTRDEAKSKNLPRIPRQAKAMLVNNALVLLFVLLPATVAAFYFYPGPAWWVPSVLFLAFFLVGLPTYGHLSAKRPDGTSPLDRLKAITDLADHDETLIELAQRNPYKNHLEDLGGQALPDRDCQRVVSEHVKDIQETNFSKVSPRFLGAIPDANPKIFVFGIKDSKGQEHLFEVLETIVEKWLVEDARLRQASGRDLDPEEQNNLSAKYASYAVNDSVLREYGSSLLLDHLQRKIEEDLELIISVDPNLNEQFGGYTPLLGAVADGFVPGVKLLLKYGANTKIANNLGATPFLFAAFYDNVELLRMLQESGANIHATDAEGNDALMKAAQMGSKTVAPLLIQWGLDVQRKNLLGHTALEMAYQSKSGEIATLIRRKMRGLSTDGNNRKGHKKRKH